MGIDLTGITAKTIDNSSNGGSAGKVITAPTNTIEQSVQVLTNRNANGSISLNVTKGLSLDLSKRMPTLKHVFIGLGWDPIDDVKQSIDLDVFALALHDGKIKSGQDVIYFNQRDVVKGVSLSQDNRTGEGEGDDESILVNLDAIPPDITSLGIFVNIYEPKSFNFGMVNNAYIRLVDSDTNEEKLIYILNEQGALFSTLHFANLIRNENGWSFDTVGQGTSGDVNEVANRYI